MNAASSLARNETAAATSLISPNLSIHIQRLELHVLLILLKRTILLAVSGIKLNPFEYLSECPNKHGNRETTGISSLISDN